MQKRSRNCKENSNNAISNIEICSNNRRKHYSNKEFTFLDICFKIVKQNYRSEWTLKNELINANAE